MQSPKDIISLVKTMLTSSKPSYLTLNTNKIAYLQIRRKLIMELRTVIDNQVMIINKEEVFYLALTYIDSILSNSNQFNMSVNQIHDGILFSCLSLAIKIIGTLTQSNDNKLLIPSKSLMEYEIKCLKCLGYQLIYSTPYDFINLMFNSNEKIFYTAKTLLASFALNDTYFNYPASIIAFGLINYSIDIIGLPQKYLIAFDKFIHSTEANVFKNEFKHLEYKKKRYAQMKTLASSKDKQSIEEAYNLSNSSKISPTKDRKTYESTETSSSTISNRSNSNSPIKGNNRNNGNRMIYNTSMNSLYRQDNNLSLNYKQFSSIKIANMSYLAKNYLSSSNAPRHSLTKGSKMI